LYIISFWWWYFVLRKRERNSNKEKEIFMSYIICTMYYTCMRILFRLYTCLIERGERLLLFYDLLYYDLLLIQRFIRQKKCRWIDRDFIFNFSMRNIVWLCVCRKVYVWCLLKLTFLYKVKILVQPAATAKLLRL
jgi:hypothetical protein